MAWVRAISTEIDEVYERKSDSKAAIRVSGKRRRTRTHDTLNTYYRVGTGCSNHIPRSSLDVLKQLNVTRPTASERRVDEGDRQ
ncbi:hypothetical protein PM082_018494 [Marasmius tenuissimus]|nr:hypothetical protein PM082_018494 [Marasmius tenuissimus]